MQLKTVDSFSAVLNVDVNTHESCSRLLQTVIQVLLFQRNQIPFCYDMFKSIVKKLEREANQKDDGDERPEWNSYQLVKQRQAAIGTFKGIEALLEELSQAVEKVTENVQAMLLFGSTIYTAKEAFVINVPAVNRNHYPQHHRQILEPALRQLAMKLTLSNELEPTGKITGPTSGFLLLATTGEPTVVESFAEGQLMEDYQLPASCRKYVIDISFHEGVDKLLCCKEMDVFSDSVDKLNVEDSLEGNVEDAARTNDSEEIAWYLIGNGIKGFKDVSIKGKSIWNAGL